MYIKNIDYSEYQGEAREWSLQGLELGHTNLIVGKNATGKTRTLNVVGGLSSLLCGRITGLRSGTYLINFNDDGELIKYHLSVQGGDIVEEKVVVAEKILLERGANGVGKIYAEELDRFIDFKIPPSILAVHGRRDTIQHPFLERFADWAENVRHYHFGADMGRRHFALLTNERVEQNEWDENLVVSHLRRALKKYGDAYKQALISDLAKIDYNVEDVTTGTPISLSGEVPAGVVCLLVVENGLQSPVDQVAVSQGMFRVISLLIQINLFLFGGKAATLVIDDIGEGLDYDRSCKLIELIRQKCDGKVQVVMSSNDRFVMNSVPLENWSILRRSGSKVTVDNFSNSREKFEDFKFTGLSNFSFFELDASTPSDRG